MSDLATLFNCQEKSARWKAERENAAARYELARINEHCAYLISQHEPISSLNIDRDKIRIVLKYIRYGDLDRLSNDLKELNQNQVIEGR